MSLPLETFDSPASKPGFIFHLPIQVKLYTKSREIQSPPLERSAEVFLLNDDEVDVEVLFARVRRDLEMS